MALFDWNKNGEDDLFDNMMDYALYKETFGKDEEEEEYDFSSEETDFESDDWDDNDLDPEGIDEPISSASIDTSLHFANSSISTEQLLKRLVDMQKRMYRTFEQFATESGYRAEVTESQQMHKDLWLYSFAKQLEYSNLSKDNKAKLLQTLLDTFGINNPMSAEEYYRVIVSNSRYMAYVSNCLETRPDKCGLFWVLLAEMSGNEGERTSDTIEFTKDYIVFMEDLEQYLQRMFNGAGFGGHIHTYMTMVIDSISSAVSDLENAILASTENFENPLYQ